MKTNIQRLMLSFFLLLYSVSVHANTSEGFMYTNGKIYVVVAVILAIFVGIVIFLITLDRKIKNLENQIFDKDE